MRKAWAASALCLSVMLALAGCVDDHTGDVGQKNIRPHYKNEYEKNGLQINGVHSYNGGSVRRRFADDGAMKMNRRNGDPRVENFVTGLHGNHHLEWSDAIARQVSAMPEVDRAYVMVTDRNAYVGVVDHHRTGGMSIRSSADAGALHDKIADHVRAASPTIQNVYVSSNPDFVGRMSNYAAAVGQGRSVQGFLTEFNAMVERVFPSLTRGPDSVSSGDTAARGAGMVGRNGTYGTQRSYGPHGTTGLGSANR